MSVVTRISPDEIAGHENWSEMLLRREKDSVQLTHERRVMRRFDMRLPAAVRLGGGQMDELGRIASRSYHDLSPARHAY